MTDRPEADYITPSEAASLLGVSTRTLARMAKRKDIRPLTLPSGHRRYLRSDVDRLIGTSA